MPPAGFEPAIPESKLAQTHTLDSTAIGIGVYLIKEIRYYLIASTNVRYRTLFIATAIYQPKSLTFPSDIAVTSNITLMRT